MRNVGIIIGLFILAIILMAVATYMDIKQESRLPSMTGFSKGAFAFGGLFALSLSSFFLIYCHIRKEDAKMT